MKWMWLVLMLAPLAAAQNNTGDAINSCDTAPADAVVQLEMPYSAWISIECDGVMKAHFASAAPDFSWREIGTGKPYRFNAYGPDSPQFSALELSVYEPHKYYFVKAVPSVMTEQQLDGVNGLLPPEANAYANIHQLDLNTSTDNIYSFFIFLEDDAPEWIVACVNYQCGRRATIQVAEISNSI